MPPASAAQEFAAKHGQELAQAESLPHVQALRQQHDLLSRLAKGVGELQQGASRALQPQVAAPTGAASAAAAAAKVAVLEASDSEAGASKADPGGTAGQGSEADGDAVMAGAQAAGPGAPAAPVPNRHASLIAVCGLVAATPLAAGPREARDQLAALVSRPVPSDVWEVVLQEDLKRPLGSVWTPGMHDSFARARGELGPAAVGGAAEAALACYQMGGLALCAAAAAARTPAEVEATVVALRRGERALRQLVVVLDESARSEQVRAMVCMMRV
jgi:hypothetical protein